MAGWLTLKKKGIRINVKIGCLSPKNNFYLHTIRLQRKLVCWLACLLFFTLVVLLGILLLGFVFGSLSSIVRSWIYFTIACNGLGKMILIITRLSRYLLPRYVQNQLGNCYYTKSFL